MLNKAGAQTPWQTLAAATAYDSNYGLWGWRTQRFIVTAGENSTTATRTYVDNIMFNSSKNTVYIMINISMDSMA